MEEFTKKRIAELTPAAERGDKVAMFKLAVAYASAAIDGIWGTQKGIDIKDCQSRALRWLEASANANYMPALIELWRIYINEYGDISYGIYYGNKELARKYHEKADKLRNT